MSALRSLLSAITAGAILCGSLSACSPPSNLAASGDAATAREQRSVETLKTQYKDVIMGTDVKGETLAVYVDVNAMYSMDEPAEDEMKAHAMTLWKRTWSATHPHKHAKLRVTLRDYYGNEIYSASARV